MQRGVLARQARPGHRAHRLQGRLAGAVAAARSAREVHGLRAGAADRRRACSRLARRRRRSSTMRSATSATLDGAARGAARRRPRSCSIWPPSRWCAGPIATRSRPTRPTSWARCTCSRRSARRRRRARRGRRHQRQVLREPRVGWGYRESDPLGGHDPYSSSKGCAELVTAAYRALVLSGAHGSTAWRSRRRAPATSSAAATGRRTGWCRTACARCRAGEPLSHPQPRRDPALAARARAASRLPAACRSACGASGGAFARGLELRPRRRGRAPVADVMDRIVGAVGRRRCAGSPTARASRTRRSCCGSTAARRAPSSAGGRGSARRRRSQWTVDWYQALAARRRHARWCTSEQIARYQALGDRMSAAPCRFCGAPLTRDLRRSRHVAAVERLPDGRASSTGRSRSIRCTPTSASAACWCSSTSSQPAEQIFTRTTRTSRPIPTAG